MNEIAFDCTVDSVPHIEPVASMQKVMSSARTWFLATCADEVTLMSRDVFHQPDMAVGMAAMAVPVTVWVWESYAKVADESVVLPS